MGRQKQSGLSSLPAAARDNDAWAINGAVEPINNHACGYTKSQLYSFDIGAASDDNMIYCFTPYTTTMMI